MKSLKKVGIVIMSLLITTATLFACEFNNPNLNPKPDDTNSGDSNNDDKDEEEIIKLPLGISKFDDGYELNANWIWADTYTKAQAAAE